MTLREQLEGKSSDQRARIKAQAFSELPTKSFTRERLNIQLSNPTFKDQTYSVDVVVTKDGKEILRDDFHIVNPPILVPDGTYHDEVDSFSGETVSVPNYKEDPEEALRQVLMSTIKQVL